MNIKNGFKSIGKVVRNNIIATSILGIAIIGTGVTALASNVIGDNSDDNLVVVESTSPETTVETSPETTIETTSEVESTTVAETVTVQETTEQQVAETSSVVKVQETTGGQAPTQAPTQAETLDYIDQEMIKYLKNINTYDINDFNFIKAKTKIYFKDANGNPTYEISVKAGTTIYIYFENMIPMGNAGASIEEIRLNVLAALKGDKVEEPGDKFLITFEDTESKNFKLRIDIPKNPVKTSITIKDPLNQIAPLKINITE